MTGNCNVQSNILCFIKNIKTTVLLTMIQRNQEITFVDIIYWIHKLNSVKDIIAISMFIHQSQMTANELCLLFIWKLIINSWNDIQYRFSFILFCKSTFTFSEQAVGIYVVLINSYMAKVKFLKPFPLWL